MSRTSPARAVGIAVAVSVIVSLLVAWFAWPAKELEPRDLPIVVAGPAPAAAAAAGQLAAARPGAFAITQVATAAEADRALRDRDAYAAFVLGPDGMSLHTASAASPTVALLLGQAAQQLGGGRPVSVVDVVPGPSEDPRGAGLAAGFLPLLVASLVAGILLAVMVAGRGARLLGVLVYALLAGALGAGVLRWLGLVETYAAPAGVVALTALAVSAAVLGFAAVLGRPGIGLGVLFVFVAGIPLSAVAAAPQLLPQPWGAIGQFLPPGAAATLLRSAAFFDGAGGGPALWTLAAWAALGLVLIAIGRARVAAAPAAQPADPPAAPAA